MPPGPARSISSRQNPPATAEQSGPKVPSAACPPAPYPQKGARMCGIVGYAGRRPGKPIILDGLRRLEYRGYDSAGIVLIEDGGLETVRSVGNLDALFAAAGEDSSKATVGLGHTRWATHGRPSYENAHPHDDCTGKVSIVVNGIVENYKELRTELCARGHEFKSETDAEVCLLYTSDAADEEDSVDLGGRRIIK